jgi:hypothetical protein
MNCVNLSALTEGHMFRLIEAESDPGGGGASDRFGTHTFSSHYPYSDSIIYDGFGSTARKTAGNPASTLAVPRLYEIVTKANLWIARLDGSQLYSTTTNTVGFSTTPRLFRDFPSTGPTGAKHRAFVLYDAQLSTGDAAAVRSWMATLM